MDRLWTPWRYQYIQGSTQRKDECIFCLAGREREDEANLVFFRARHNFCLLNRFPYNSGHFMIAPYAHVATLAEADEAAAMEMMLLARYAERILRAEYRPTGFNIGLNLGTSAGAGIAGHLHLHVVPRWEGDANFMTTLGETRVLPEDLSVTHHRLQSAFASLSPTFPSPAISA